jgi:DNA helicase II / ATP-dependent DNA helicase PcrA
MAKRKFELPGIHELSKEQERAIRLPMEGCHLIVGGPGTGKTVVTLLRLRRHLQQFQEHESLFLVFNRLLHEAARQLFGEGLKSSTWRRWFTRMYCEHVREPVPKLESDSDFKPIDWQTVIDKITEKDISIQKGKPFLFIDEGQDMPPRFYDALIRLGFENFYVVADQNQAITSENSSRQQLQDAFAIDSDRVIELTQNFRNALPVARLATALHPADPATPPLVLPKQSSSDEAALLIEYGPECRVVFEEVIERILKLADRDPRKLIGIITPNNLVREKYLNAILQMTGSSDIKLDNGAPRVVTYAYGKESDHKFDEGGIFVINAQSCKGLEFDTVFIADIQAFNCHPGIQDEKRRLFYVMVARARERVFLLKEANQHCPIDCILPSDTEIMKHWR